MSFCRFSSDDFHCDFYAYEAEHGYVLHVAATRITWDPPPSPLQNLDLEPSEWQELYHRYHEALQSAPRSPVLHPSAGATAVFATLAELRNRIAQLVSQGLHAPPWLLPDLDALIAAEGHEQPDPTGDKETTEDSTRP